MDNFDRLAYLDEIAALLAEAKTNFSGKAPNVTVYTLNVWTDPAAATSAVSFDTRENSDAMIAFRDRQVETRRERLRASGTLEGADNWQDQDERICNPADFVYPNIAEFTHNSISPGWEEESEGQCWDVLEPVLLEVRAMAQRVFSDLSLDPEAELSVNSRLDWYDNSCPMLAE